MIYILIKISRAVKKLTIRLNNMYIIQLHGAMRVSMNRLAYVWQ